MKKTLLVFCWLLSISGLAQERILDFQSNVTVNTDRSVDVTEIIKVKAEGVNIQHGIFRDIITVSENKGRRSPIQFTVKEVLKNGQREEFTIEDVDNVTRIKIGSADVFLQSGEYTYSITYNLGRRVRFFETYDEVYWNATGNDWQFSIERASVNIYLPSGAIISQHAGYSGPSGTSGCDCSFEKKSDRIIHYEVQNSLNPYEGLTVAVGWQKGIVPPPTQAEIDQDEFEANKGIYYGAVGLFILCCYLLIAWFIVGRDPRSEAIIPRFEPPDGYSPAACRYVLEMGYDNKAFTASLISMAVKGYLIVDKSSKKYVLVKADKGTSKSKLTREEERVYNCLFSGSNRVSLSGDYDSSLAGAVAELKSNLTSDFKIINFKKNSGWMVPAIFAGLAIWIVVLWSLGRSGPLFGRALVGSILGLIVVFTLINGVRKFRQSVGFRKALSVIRTLILLGIFLALPGYFILSLGAPFDWALELAPYIAINISVALVIALFFYLIQAPTVLGRKRMDEIEGLKMFMDVAEKDRLNMLNPPEKTPQLFERLLPFAMALGVENSWGKQFESIIAEAIRKNEYQPTWYVGDRDNMSDMNYMTSSLGSSLSSAVSSSSTPPSDSSSSGSDGGGSSGGGDGGGGGGGW